MHKHYPDPDEFETILVGMIQAGMISVDRHTRMVVKLIEGLGE